MDFVRKNDKLISLGVLLLTVIFVFVFTRNFFLSFAHDYVIIGGFIKFFFLASMGDFVGLRLRTGSWSVPNKIIQKAIVWGLIGAIIGIVFTIFSSGVLELQSRGVLPFEGVAFATAFFTSVFMNLIFAPTMMSFHRISDQYLDSDGSFTHAIKEVNWVHFYKVVLFKTVPLFWIPAHTITFLLPDEYRIIFAAVLGIALGLLLSLFRK